MAYSCKRMMDELGLTQEQVAQRLERSLHHHKFLRLLKLPALIQAELRDLHRNQNADEGNEGNTSIVFSIGHARAL